MRLVEAEIRVAVIDVLAVTTSTMYDVAVDVVLVELVIVEIVVDVCVYVVDVVEVVLE